MLVDGWDVEHRDESAFHANNGRLGMPVQYPVMLFSLTVLRGSLMYAFFHAT
jgi:hypothetical protein